MLGGLALAVRPVGLSGAVAATVELLVTEATPPEPAVKDAALLPSVAVHP